MCIRLSGVGMLDMATGERAPWPAPNPIPRWYRLCGLEGFALTAGTWETLPNLWPGAAPAKLANHRFHGFSTQPKHLLDNALRRHHYGALRRAGHPLAGPSAQAFANAPEWKIGNRCLRSARICPGSAGQRTGGAELNHWRQNKLDNALGMTNISA